MTLNKAFASLAAFALLFLAAWTPLETSNNSVVRLSMFNQDFCSGVVVEELPGGFYSYVATAAHCAEATSEYIEKKVYLPNGHFKIKSVKVFHNIRIKQDRVTDEGRLYLSIDTEGSFVRWDVKNDVAIYKIISEHLMFTPAKLGDGHVKYGDKVYAMGMPLSIWGTITSGEVNKPMLGNTQGIPEYIPQDAILHTAYMKPGISGGGLFNDKGELIGLTNWGQAGGPYLATRVIHVLDLLKVINENK